MKAHVGIGMPVQTLVVGHGDTTQNHMVAGGEAVDIEPEPGAGLGHASGEQALGAGQIFRCRHFDIVRAAQNQRYR